MLTLSPDYFRIRKPLDRRIYEIVRKHCGKQPKWEIGLKTLHLKTGSTAPIRNFKIAIKSLVDSNDLPAYRISYDDLNDKVIFYNKGTKGNQALIKDLFS